MRGRKEIKEYGPKAPVPISQYEAEFSKLLRIYKMLKPKNVLEIGTHHGGTLYHWLRNHQQSGKVVSIDDHHINEFLYSGWVGPYTKFTKILGKSQDPHVIDEAYKYAPYDWIFIDGGHEFHEVHADWENYRQLASKASVIVFHDILPHPHSDVYKLWEIIKRQDYATMELVEDRYTQDGCGIGVVFYDGV